jgi:hypothetical protein
MPKQPILRDRAYLDHLRTQPCILTGFRATDSEAVGSRLRAMTKRRPCAFSVMG